MLMNMRMKEGKSLRNNRMVLSEEEAMCQYICICVYITIYVYMCNVFISLYLSLLSLHISFPLYMCTHAHIYMVHGHEQRVHIHGSCLDSTKYKMMIRILCIRKSKRSKRSGLVWMGFYLFALQFCYFRFGQRSKFVKVW